MSAAKHKKHHRTRLVHKAPPKIDGVRNDINVTPLVDVCLVLLIIFMVILPMMERGKDVKVPGTRHHLDAKDNNEPIVAIDTAGKIFVDKAEVPDLEAMKVAVQDEWNVLASRNAGANVEDRSGETRVLLKAAADVEYAKVYPVIIALHDMGAVGIDLGTTERKDGQE
jgi:biopolymer transport protein TolR